MASIEVDVDIDIEDYLDEVSVTDLIYELSERKLNISQQNTIKEILKGVEVDGLAYANTIVDEVKMDIVIKGISSKTLTEIQEFFK